MEIENLFFAFKNRAANKILEIGMVSPYAVIF